MPEKPPSINCEKCGGGHPTEEHDKAVRYIKTADFAARQAGEVRWALKHGERKFDGKDLTDLELAGENFEGASFRNADVRGLLLYPTEGGLQEPTNLRGTNWTDATFADFGGWTLFQYVNAEGATFGFSESLEARRRRQKYLGKKPLAQDTGGFHNFDGRDGNFRGTKWTNIDFGGDVDADGRPLRGWETLFTGADLSGANFDGVDLRGIDWSINVVINDIVIKDPESLYGLTIRSEQVPALAQGIALSDAGERETFAELRDKAGDAQALRKYYGVLIKE